MAQVEQVASMDTTIHQAIAQSLVTDRQIGNDGGDNTIHQANLKSLEAKLGGDQQDDRSKDSGPIDNTLINLDDGDGGEDGKKDGVDQKKDGDDGG